MPANKRADSALPQSRSKTRRVDKTKAGQISNSDPNINLIGDRVRNVGIKTHLRVVPSRNAHVNRKQTITAVHSRKGYATENQARAVKVVMSPVFSSQAMEDLFERCTLNNMSSEDRLSW